MRPFFFGFGIDFINRPHRSESGYLMKEKVMLLIYAHNTRKKTGWIVTEDIIPPRGGPYRPISYSHPDTAKAELLMLALSRFFVHDTNRCSRPTLKQAYEGAQQYLANPQDYKYLSATSTAAERILVK